MLVAERSKWIHLKATEAEHAALKRLARASGLTMADLIRSAIDQKQTGIQPKAIRAGRKADPLLLASLGRIGNNLNQIAHWANTHKGGADAVSVIAALAALEREVMALRPQAGGGDKEAAGDAGPVL